MGLFDRFIGQRFFTRDDDDGGIEMSTNNTLESGEID